MEFVNEFVVPAPVEQAWTLLTDVPRIAPCLPGATVREAPGGTFEGTVKVKVGPIRVSYGGVASFVELNDGDRNLVLEARGKEDGGKGSLSAVVRVQLVEQGAETKVQVVTELQVTGRVAQFGRSAMADVGEGLVGQFAANLASLLAGASAQGGRPAASRPPGAPPAPSAVGLAESAEFNALSLAGPLLKRAVPSTIALALGILCGTLLGRASRCSGNAPQLQGWVLCRPVVIDDLRHS